MGLIIVVCVIVLVDIIGVIAALKVASDEDDRMGME